MPKLITLLLSAFLFQVLLAQDSVQQRIILIGDAGEINLAQKAILADAVGRTLPGKTMALFLGDNIYPHGFELTGEAKSSTENILRSQFEGLRKNGITVYFVPGNHDWDKSGPLGYEKIIAANKFITNQQDSLLRMIPKDGCPGPYELAVSDSLVIVAMDSEWWLYPFDNHAAESDCPCKTKEEVLARLEDIVRRNSRKVIIFATHHPFRTYGSHGGYYSIREHLFPLTDINKYLYIPLPVIGSLYPLVRKAFPPPEDLGNVLNRDMQQAVDAVLRQHPNVLHVSGHEHTLQLIQDDLLQVVSGAGCKHTPVKYGKGSIYAASASGYVVADVMVNQTVRLSFYTYKKGKVKETFTYTKPYNMALPLPESIKGAL